MSILDSLSESNSLTPNRFVESIDSETADLIKEVNNSFRAFLKIPISDMDDYFDGLERFDDSFKALMTKHRNWNSATGIIDGIFGESWYLKYGVEGYRPPQFNVMKLTRLESCINLVTITMNDSKLLEPTVDSMGGIAFIKRELFDLASLHPKFDYRTLLIP